MTPKLPTLPQLLKMLGANELLVLLPMILMIVAIGIFVFKLLKKARVKAAGPAAPEEGRAQEEPGVKVEIILPPALPSARLIRRTVAKGFRTLRERVANRALRYRTPLFLLVGSEGSGKTTLLRQLMPEAVSPSDSTQAIGSRWHYFDRAVAIEVDGRLLLSEAHPGPSEESWNALNKALRFHRPERPIDGFVLAIPATELYGLKRLDSEQLTTRARAIFKRLQGAQRILGVRVPLYLVVTKCDLVQGFQDLCTALPEEKRGETFGWSNPYALESTFVPEYIDEAFDSLSSDLFEVQMELLARGAAEDADGLFQFSGSFRALQSPLRTFATELCRESAYQESFFFRGLYFTGDGSSDAAERLIDAAYYEPDRNTASEGSVLPPLPATLAVSREPYFLNDLFGEKIFGEAGLARSVAGSRLSRNRAILGIQAAIAAIVLIGGLGSWRATTAIERESGLLISTLEDIESDLRFLEQTDEAQAGIAAPSSAALSSRVFPMLSSMARVTGTVSSFFLPSSWISPLHWEISESMREGFVRVVLPSMHASLLAKADSIVAPPILADLSKTTIDGGELPRYLSAVARLGQGVEQYDTVSFIGGDTELQSLVKLVKYLYGHDLPEEFDERAAYYRRALDESYGERIAARDRPMFASQVVDRSEALLRDYYDALIYRLEDINIRFESAESMQRLTSADLDDFRQLRVELAEVARVLDGSEPFWFDDTQALGPRLVETIDSIPTTTLTPSEDIKTGFTDMFYRVRREKLDELNYRLDPYQTGDASMTAAGESSTMSLSPQLASLQMSLDTLFSQPFIASAPPPARRPPPPAGSRIRWDVAGLDRALQEYAQYEAFLASREDADNPGMSRLMQGLATVQLEARLRAAVQQSMLAEPTGFAYGLRDRERALRSRVAAFQEPSARLLDIIARMEALGMEETYEEFAGLYIDQSLGMLAEVDALLEEGGAYRPLGGTLASWDGRQPAIYPAFRARDEEELDRYLEQQRSRVRYLIDNFAAPLLGGLTADAVAPVVGSGGDGAAGLVSKWSGLVEELDRYEAQSGSSSVEVLEQFIREEMAASDVATCVANSGRRPSAGGDFFLAARNRLRTELYSRCEQLALTTAQEVYTQLADFFNANLAGRYPFSRDGAGTAAEADIEIIQQFYALYDGLGAFRSAVGGQGATFIERMGEVRSFLRPLLNEEAASGPTYGVSVAFRTNRDEEQGADQIVGWTMALGGTAVSYRGEAEQQTATWRPGSPASLSLRWALQSTDRPAGGERYAGASVSDREALFRYTGRWGLLRLIQNHIAASNGTQGHLLRFEVPTVRMVGNAGATPGSTAQVFVQIRLSDAAGASVGALPIFPAQAPAYR